MKEGVPGLKLRACAPLSQPKTAIGRRILTHPPQRMTLMVNNKLNVDTEVRYLWGVIINSRPTLKSWPALNAIPGKFT